MNIRVTRPAINSNIDIVLNWYEMAPNVCGKNWSYKEILLPCGLQLQPVKQQYNKSFISLQK